MCLTRWSSSSTQSCLKRRKRRADSRSFWRIWWQFCCLCCWHGWSSRRSWTASPCCLRTSQATYRVYRICWAWFRSASALTCRRPQKCWTIPRRWSRKSTAWPAPPCRRSWPASAAWHRTLWQSSPRLRPASICWRTRSICSISCARWRMPSCRKRLRKTRCASAIMPT